MPTNRKSVSIYKTNDNFESINCSIYNFPNEFFGYENAGITQISYTPNGTDPNEIHLVADTINVRYFKNLNLFKDNDRLVKYQEVDVTSCLWPNYISELQTCDPDLPEFILEDMHTIELSETNPTNITFIAFHQCSDAKFLFRVCSRIPSENVTCDTPLWISINETLKSFTIDTSKVLSVGQIKLIFQSQLIGFSFLNYYVNNTILTHTSFFRFTNENCVLRSSLSDWYVIVQQIANFTIAFEDKENDRVLMSIVNNRACNAFIQTQNASAFNLMVMCNDNTVSRNTITLKYTDKFHQDSQYWVQIDININIFKSQPPVFANKITPIQINLCEQGQLIFKLPDIIDVDSSLFNISLTSSAPVWIHVQTSSNEFQNLSNSFYIEVDILSPLIPNQASNVSITVILSDDSGAFTNYILDVEFLRSKAINLNNFGDINVDAQHAFQVPLNSRASTLYASSCSTSQPINWICYNDEEQTLYVFNQTKCGFEFDECNNSNIYNTNCVKLIFTDKCNNVIESNEFNVTINASSPPAQTNIFSQIDVYQNHYVNSKLPAYLFTNQSEAILNFNTLGCVNYNDVKVATRITIDQESGIVSIYVKVFGDKGCQISIYTNSSLCQVSEALIDVVVKRCASKDCFECSGPYDSNCISCNSGYVLESDGTCVRDVNYLPTTNIKLYWIYGLFTMIMIFIFIILSIRYGKCMFEPVVHLQTLMMLMLSSDCVSSNWIEYFSWIQYFKFDFGFFNLVWLNHITSCTVSNTKFANSKFYCQETIFNYSNVVAFAIILFAIIKLVKIANLSQKLKFINVIEIQPQTTFWMLWCLVLPFLLVNTLYDLLTIKSHPIASLLSSCLIALLLCFCILKRALIMNNEFMQKIDQYKSLPYIYLFLLMRIPLILLFAFSLHIFTNMLMMVILIMQCLLLFILINQNIKLPLQNNFNRLTEIFSNVVMTIVIFAITIQKFMVKQSIECSSSIIYSEESNTDLALLLLIMTMNVCSLSIAILKVVSELILLI